MKYKYLLFDADNTLFDFCKAERAAFLKLANFDSAFTAENYSLYHEINDKMWKMLEKGEITREKMKVERFAEFFRVTKGSRDEEKAVEISAQYSKYLAESNYLIDGAKELLSHISKDFPIYIITNGISAVQRGRFAKSEITQYITKLYISEEIGYEKPKKEFFDFVLSDIGDCDRTKYLVIGDSLSSDIDGAVAAGIDSVYFDMKNKGTDGRKITYRVSKLSEIADIVK